MMLVRGVIVGVVALVAAGAGCKSNSGAQGPSADQFGRFLADAFCGALVDCCAAASTASNGAACRSVMATVFNAPVDSLKHGNTTYDSGAAAACATAMHDREAKCAGDAGPPGGDTGYIDPVVYACAGVFKGTLAAGATCTTSFECATNGPGEYAECAASSLGGVGKTCLVTGAHVAPGGACTNVHVDHVLLACEPATGYCDYDADAGTTGTCKAYVGIGGNCVGIASRAPLCDPATSYCDAQISRTCVPLPRRGEPCPGQACTAPLACDTTLTPAVCVDLQPLGGPCTTSTQCASQYCGGTGVEPDGGTVPGKCAAPGGLPAASVFDIPRTCAGDIMPPGVFGIPPLAPLTSVR